MNKGKISLEEGEIDLKMSMECGQTFLWNKISGVPLYKESSCKKFYKVFGDDIVVLWQEGTDVKYKGTAGEEKVREFLNLDISLANLRENTRDDEILKKSLREFEGLRVLNDEFFPCLISYIISAQMRIPRIKKLVDSIAERWGGEIEFEGQTFQKFPTPEQLSEATVEDLEDLGLGYRAKYVRKTTDQILNGKISPESLKEMEYPEAKKELKKLMGVGNKVADCVLLFSLGFHESYPLDTWGKKIVDNLYPHYHDTRYWKISENMRDYFGEFAGWYHEYLFHWARENREDLN